MGMSDYDDDLTRAYGLLGGSVRYNKRGLPFNYYLKDGDSEELEARMAIAMLLRSRRVNGQLLNMLASLFDPRPRVLPDGKAHPDFLHIAERRIVFRYRARGNRNNDLANTVIARNIWHRIRAGTGIGEAIQATADEFNLSHEQAEDVWGRYKKYMLLEEQWENERKRVDADRGAKGG
jgi:hypothetical protein